NGRPNSSSTHARIAASRRATSRARDTRAAAITRAGIIARGLLHGLEEGRGLPGGRAGRRGHLGGLRGIDVERAPAGAEVARGLGLQRVAQVRGLAALLGEEHEQREAALLERGGLRM